MSNFVEAAGAIVQRRTPQGTLEICVVHRPRYDDWSFPKGKLEAHESHAHAAVREVEEETGIAIRLSTRLTEISYPLHADGSEGSRDKSRKVRRRNKKYSKTKHVVYWLGEILDAAAASKRQDAFGARIERDKEADNVEWLSFEKALERLSYESDRALLKDLETTLLGTGSEAPTATVIITRHGKAESRKHWKGSEASRPLTPNGAGASFALSRELACFAPTRLITSPWHRCSQTLVPYAVSSHSDLHEANELTEDTVENDAEQTYEFLLDTLRTAARTPDAPIVVCTHRPVFEAIFPRLASLCASEDVAAQIPSESPYLQMANGLALSVVLDKDGPSITALQKVEPLVY